jgi:hypothetical protein
MFSSLYLIKRFQKKTKKKLIISLELHIGKSVSALVLKIWVKLTIHHGLFYNSGRSGFAMFSLNSGWNTKISDCYICKQWTTREANTLKVLETRWNDMPMCPCDKNTIQVAGFFEKTSILISSDIIDTYSIKSNEEYNYQGMVSFLLLCYSRN